MKKITHEPISIDENVNKVFSTSSGAVISFSGLVRDNADGNNVLRMEYEAEEEMAADIISKIEVETKDKFPITDISIQHRLGMLELGEASVIIAVSAPHRVEAYEASRYAIDTLKKIVPIWKKEYFDSSNSEWVKGNPVKV